MLSVDSPPRTVHFLVHVPKCAGTTVEWHFRDHLRSRFLWAPRWRNPLRDIIGNRFPSLDPAALHEIAVVSGHSLSANLAAHFPGAEIREYVLLRDPVGWHLSMYNYRLERSGGDGPSFVRWYRTVRRNPISRFLLNRYFGIGVPALYGMSSAARLACLESRLARFAFVAGLDRTDEMIGTVSEAVGISGQARAQNTIPKKRVQAGDLPSGMINRIRADNRLDQVLFDRWSSRGVSGAPTDAPPKLPRLDHIRHAASDLQSALLRKLG